MEASVDILANYKVTLSNAQVHECSGRDRISESFHQDPNVIVV
jgi:hypothetical protein